MPVTAECARFSLDVMADRIQQQSNQFAMGVKNKATSNSKLNDGPDENYHDSWQAFITSHSCPVQSLNLGQ